MARSTSRAAARVTATVARGAEAAARLRQTMNIKGQAHALNQERLKEEESEDWLQERMDKGTISDEDAQRIRARREMHERDASSPGGTTGRSSIDETAAAAAGIETTQRIIEEVLDVREGDRNWAVVLFETKTGLNRLREIDQKQRRLRAQPGWKHRCPRLYKFVQSLAFELAVGMVMMVNAVTIGMQTSMSEEAPKNSPINIMEHVFTAVFVLEVILRIIAHNPIWLYKPANFIDTMLILLTGVLPLWILEPLNLSMGAARALQVLRLIRLVRVVRVVRTHPLFRILWSLIRGVMESGLVIVWTYTMVLSVLFVFAVLGVYIIGRAEEFEGDTIAGFYFGDFPKALLTWFQVMTLDNWTLILRPLMGKSLMALLLFLFLIAVGCQVLLNLVTAVIVNNAMEREKADQELQARVIEEETNRRINELHKLFKDIDTDGSGKLSEEEYHDAVANNHDVRTKFALLEISPAETEEIWELLDDGSGEIDVEHFAEGLRKMQSGTMAKDSFSIVRRLHRLNMRVQILSDKLAWSNARALELLAEAQELQHSVGLIYMQIREVLVKAGTCLPKRAITRSGKDLGSMNLDIGKRVADLLDEEARHRPIREDLASRGGRRPALKGNEDKPVVG